MTLEDVRARSDRWQGYDDHRRLDTYTGRHETLALANEVPKLLAALEALEEICVDIDGNEHEHVEYCGGEPTCPACWALDIRKTITEALQ